MAKGLVNNYILSPHKGVGQLKVFGVIFHNILLVMKHKSIS